MDARTIRSPVSNLRVLTRYHLSHSLALDNKTIHSLVEGMGPGRSDFLRRMARKINDDYGAYIRSMSEL
jgi:hypothetical protein